MPTAILGGLSPIQKLFGVLPDYGALRVFGCSCFPILRPYNSQKMSYRSTKCIFMGYSLNHKGYKFLDLSTNIMYISRHVLFNENHFPFSVSTVYLGVVPSSLPQLSSTVSAKPPLVPSLIHSQHSKSIVHSPANSNQHASLPLGVPTLPSSISQSQLTAAQSFIPQATVQVQNSSSDTSLTRYLLHPAAHPFIATDSH